MGGAGWLESKANWGKGSGREAGALRWRRDGRSCASGHWNRTGMAMVQAGGAGPEKVPVAPQTKGKPCGGRGRDGQVHRGAGVLLDPNLIRRASNAPGRAWVQPLSRCAGRVRHRRAPARCTLTYNQRLLRLFRGSRPARPHGSSHPTCLGSSSAGCRTAGC